MRSYLKLNRTHTDSNNSREIPSYIFTFFLLKFFFFFFSFSIFSLLFSFKDGQCPQKTYGWNGHQMVHCLNPIYLVVLGLIEAYGWCIGEAGGVLYRVGVPLPTSTLSTMPSEVLLLAFILPLNQETPQEKGSWNLLLGTNPFLFIKRNKSARVSYWDFILLLKKKKKRETPTHLWSINLWQKGKNVQ